MDKYYVIKLIPKSGQRGYVIDSPKGIMISLGVVADIKQFKTTEDAKKFIKDNRLERSGAKAHIRTNEDLMQEESSSVGLVRKQGDMFRLEDESGNKLFYDTKLEGYFFDKQDVGYCVWNSEEDLKKFVEAYEFMEKTIIVKI